LLSLSCLIRSTRQGLSKKLLFWLKTSRLKVSDMFSDESDREGMRIAIGLKKDQVADVLINQLFRQTQMETSFGIIFLAVVDNRPMILNFKDILEHFVIHRKDVIIRRTAFDLRKAEERAHILEGLKIALENLDEVVKLIRESKTPGEARTGLMERFGLTQIQAQAILDMRLQRLTGLEQEKILEEYEQILKDIQWFRQILSQEKLVLDIIKDELTQIEEVYGDERRTRIVEETKEIT
jgi:DNA gyrase subunit A